MTIDDQAATLQREQAITTVCDHISAGTIAQKFLNEALDDLAADDHDGVWIGTVLLGLDLMRSIANVMQSQANDLRRYGTQDVPF